MSSPSQLIELEKVELCSSGEFYPFDIIRCLSLTLNFRKTMLFDSFYFSLLLYVKYFLPLVARIRLLHDIRLLKKVGLRDFQRLNCEEFYKLSY